MTPVLNSFSTCPPNPSSPRSIRAASNGSCATCWPTPSTTASTPVTLTMRSDGDAVAITVRDNGIGLRPGEGNSYSTDSGGRIRPGPPLRWHRTRPGSISIEDARLHSAGSKRGANQAKAPVFRLTLPLVRGHKNCSVAHCRSNNPATAESWRPKETPRVTAHPGDGDQCCSPCSHWSSGLRNHTRQLLTPADPRIPA